MTSAITIIGRGIIGLSCAYRFAKAGFKVQIVGPSNEVGSASHVALGVSAIKGDRIARTPLFAAKMLGHKNLQKWIHEIEDDSLVKIECDFTGVIEPFSSPEDKENLLSRLGVDEFATPFSPTLLCAEKVQQIFGANCDAMPMSGAFFYENDGWCDVPSLLFSLETALKRFGAEFIEEKVETLVANPDSSITICFLNKTLVVRRVLLAAGFFSKKILASSGFSALNLISHPGQVLRTDFANENFVVGTKRKHNFFIRKGELQFGATTFHGDEFIEKDKVEGISLLKEGVKSTFGRGISTEGARFSWGIRSRFKDRLPAVGEVTLSCDEPAACQLLVALGFYKNGLQLADLTARFLVSHVSRAQVNEELSEIFNHFSPNRFLTNAAGQGKLP